MITIHTIMEEVCVVADHTPREDLDCMCCRFLMVEPTTLICGHSFCRFCLVTWCNQSNKSTCMVCQNPWNTLPSVSITIRNMIDSQYHQEYRERCEEVLTEENKAIVREFENKSRHLASFGATFNNLVGGAAQVQMRQGQLNLNHLKNKYFLYGIVFAILVGFMWMVGSYLFRSEQSLTTKPLVKWSKEEVSQWLAGLGPWTEDTLMPVFYDKTIDGALLIALSETEEDLTSILAGLDNLHQKAFKVALEGLMDLGTKPPQDFWEYKSLHLFQVLCFCFITPTFPRLMLVQLYLFEYRDSFLPLVHRICPVIDGISDISLYTYQLEALTGKQWIDFIWKVLFVPYFSVYMDFVCTHLWTTNVFVAMYLMLDCLVMTYLQLLYGYIWYKRGWGFVWLQMKATPRMMYNTWVNVLVVYLLWNFIPTFLCNIVFYFFGIFGPFGRVMLLQREQRMLLNERL